AGAGFSAASGLAAASPDGVCDEAASAEVFSAAGGMATGTAAAGAAGAATCATGVAGGADGAERVRHQNHVPATASPTTITTAAAAIGRRRSLFPAGAVWPLPGAAAGAAPRGWPAGPTSPGRAGSFLSGGNGK